MLSITVKTTRKVERGMATARRTRELELRLKVEPHLRLIFPFPLSSDGLFLTLKGVTWLDGCVNVKILSTRFWAVKLNNYAEVEIISGPLKQFHLDINLLRF
jgi:hypothetical protein